MELDAYTYGLYAQYTEQWRADHPQPGPGDSPEVWIEWINAALDAG